MHDKILGFLRETMLHENEVESLSVDLATGHVKLALLQPDEKSSWPDHELILTFSGVRELSAGSTGSIGHQRSELLGIEYLDADQGNYRVMISVGETGTASWSLILAFTDLHYQRT